MEYILLWIFIVLLFVPLKIYFELLEDNSSALLEDYLFILNCVIKLKITKSTKYIGLEKYLGGDATLRYLNPNTQISTAPMMAGNRTAQALRAENYATASLRRCRRHDASIYAVRREVRCRRLKLWSEVCMVTISLNGEVINIHEIDWVNFKMCILELHTTDR